MSEGVGGEGGEGYALVYQLIYTNHTSLLMHSSLPHWFRFCCSSVPLPLPLPVFLLHLHLLLQRFEVVSFVRLIDLVEANAAGEGGGGGRRGLHSQALKARTRSIVNAPRGKGEK